MVRNRAGMELASMPALRFYDKPTQIPKQPIRASTERPGSTRDAAALPFSLVARKWSLPVDVLPFKFPAKNPAKKLSPCRGPGHLLHGLELTQFFDDRVKLGRSLDLDDEIELRHPVHR